MNTPSNHQPEHPLAPLGSAGSVATESALALRRSVEHSGLHWVPIRSLAPRHRERIAAHILALDPQDRYLRFGHMATDEQIRRYVDQLDFERDELFGIFNRRLVLIAMAHLAYAPLPSISPAPGTAAALAGATAEFGVSVLARARGRGYGARLFDRAVLHARNRGCQRLFIHALSENSAMLKIASNAGATVERAGPESEAWLKLPPEDLLSRMDEIVETHAAEFNYQLKVQAHRVSEWLGVAKDVGDHTPAEGRDDTT